MNQKLSVVTDRIFKLSILLLLFIYLFAIVNPALWFHEIQPPFLLTADFFLNNIKSPGGFSVWSGNLIMQAFYTPIPGTIVYFILILLVAVFIYLLLQQLNKNILNKVFALLPLILSVTLAASYNFPLSTVVSLLFVVLFLFPVLKIKNQFYFLIYFFIAAFFVFVICGSGYLWIFSVSTVFVLFEQNSALKRLNIVYVGLISFLIAWIAISFIFPDAENHGYFQFFEKDANNPFNPNFFFFLYAFCFPVLFGLQRIVLILLRKNSKEMPLRLRYSVFLVLLIVAIASHKLCYNSDDKKIVESDYYYYHHDLQKTAKAATSTVKYSFSANINYILAIINENKLTEEFFNFFQISGIDALYPDNRLPSEGAILSSEFYYKLGDISESVNWAGKALITYPYSSRVLQLLVKNHLVLAEYIEAEKYLKVLQDQLIAKDFVKKYKPYLSDTALIHSDQEIMQKRMFMPVFYEKPKTPDQRFLGLVKANPENKTAFECLMLYYMLAGDFSALVAHFDEIKNYFDQTPQIYEEAILMYGATENLSVADNFHITETSINRFKLFADELKARGDNDRVAMNELYSVFGKTYFYYYYFVLPQVLMPDYAKKDELQTE